MPWLHGAPFLLLHGSDLVMHSYIAAWSACLSWTTALLRLACKPFHQGKASQPGQIWCPCRTVTLHTDSGSPGHQHATSLLIRAGAFSPGVPAAFLTNFEAANKFLGQLEAMCPTKASLQVGSVLVRLAVPQLNCC